MLTVYPACFFREDSDGYSVIFPDLNHLSTCGDSINKAMEMAVDCLAGYIYWLEKDGDPVPVPSPMEAVCLETVAGEIYPDAVLEGSFVNMVSVDVEEYAKIQA